MSSNCPRLRADINTDQRTRTPSPQLWDDDALLWKVSTMSREVGPGRMLSCMRKCADGRGSRLPTSTVPCGHHAPLGNTGEASRWCRTLREIKEHATRKGNADKIPP